MINKPQVGDRYYDNGDRKWRAVVEVGNEYDDGLGCLVWCDNGVGYDCYWSDKLNCWQYFPPGYPGE